MIGLFLIVSRVVVARHEISVSCKCPYMIGWKKDSRDDQADHDASLRAPVTDHVRRCLRNGAVQDWHAFRPRLWSDPNCFVFLVSDPLCLFSSLALHFFRLFFLVHHLVNWDDQHLLAHAMASDFSVAWQCLSKRTIVFFCYGSNSMPEWSELFKVVIISYICNKLSQIN
jgi:hypothetical protein